MNTLINKLKSLKILHIFIIVISIITITTLLIILRLPEYNPSNLINCDEGKYSPNEYMENEADLRGYNIEYISIIKTKQYMQEICESYIKLSTPIYILGSQINNLPGPKCNLFLVENSRKKEYNDEKIWELACK